MTEKRVQKSVSPEDKRIDRRKFLVMSGKAAIVAPPAVGLLISATDAKAHCTSNGNSIHTTPSCATNH